MAKDKSKSKGNDEFAKPSDAPAGDSWSLTDGDEPKSGQNDGSLFMITPLREIEVAVTRGKKTEDVKVIVADVVLINEKKPAKSEEHSEVYVWAKWVQGSLRGFIGTDRVVLGRLDKTADAASAVGYVWKLADADDDDIAIAREYLASIDPFPKAKGKGKVETKAGSKAKGDKAEKGKKSKPAPEPEPKKGKGKKKK